MSALRDRLLEQARARASARAGQEPSALTRRRAEAREDFAERGLPTRRDEDWRFTPLRRLDALPLEPAVRFAGPLPAQIERIALPGALVLPFVGGFAASASPDAPAGLRLVSLAEQLAEDAGALCSWLGALAEDKLRALTALNTACFEDGALIEIAPGVEIDRPIHVIFWQPGEAPPRIAQPRTRIALGARSRATVIEHHVGAPGSGALVNAVTEIELASGARLDHVQIQQHARDAHHFAQTIVRQERDSALASRSIAMGAALSRVEIATRLEGEGAHALLHGLYCGRGEQHVDHHTTIDHASPHTTSEELYKGILDERAHGVFHGRIHVRPDAQKIAAQQTNRTLLLCDGPTINTKPQLEIHADDVRCSHGATIGRLDAQALFYLRSRGIGEAEARALLTLAFAREISQALPVSELAARLERTIPEWLQGGSR
jgi:Fe-S cluster assembly protein SufD